MSVLVDWKPERAVQAKIRDTKKIIILIGRNPKREIYAKIKDHNKVPTSFIHHPLGASRHQKTSDSKRLQIKDSEQGQFKVVRENSGYCVQCTSPIYLPFSKFFQRSVEPCHWQVTTQLIKFELVPIYLKFSFIQFTKFLLFLVLILKAKKFKKSLKKILSFEMHKQQVHFLWTYEYLNMHQHLFQGHLNSAR